MRLRRDESRGNATVAMLTVIGLVAMATAVALAVAVAIQTRHRAVAAADAAALAVAADALAGPSSACTRGSELAARNGARLVSCVIADAIAEVTVQVSPPGVLAGFGPVVERARAGPASVR
ncbi:MAG TPA: Rv3654c family TadE-like protein [Mycobacteriales bacterium]|nr:Rv3654c family TadE-like protein [Mycobacteriales bacterium]